MSIYKKCLPRELLIMGKYFFLQLGDLQVSYPYNY